jgi:hypothetical protein
MTPMRPKVVKALAKDEPKVSKPMTPSRTALILSQNWVALQKSLSPATSRKRKRESMVKPSKRTPNPTHKAPAAEKTAEKKGYTTYDPWHPNESALPRRTGNPSLIQLSNSGEGTTKYCPSERTNPDMVVT